MDDSTLSRLDARGRDAAAALHAAAPTPRMQGLAKSTSATATWVRPVALLAVAASIVALLVVVPSLRRDAVDRDTDSLRYVIGDLPADWSVLTVKDPGVELEQSHPDDSIALYGTSDDPSAPTIQLYVPEQEVLVDAAMLFNATEVRQFEVDGRASGCGTEVYRAPRWLCMVQTERGGVLAYAAHVSFEQLSASLQTMVLQDRVPALDPAALPAGMTLLWAGSTGEESAVGTGSGASKSTAAVGYQAGAQRGGFLTVGWADEEQLAAAFNDTMHPVTIQGVVGHAGSNDATGTMRAVWTVGERSFSLSITGTEEELLAMAESVRPATETEWASLLLAAEEATPDTNPPGTAPTTTLPPDVPVTMNPAVQTVVDVPVTLSIGGVSSDDVHLSAALPDGTFGGIDLAIIGNYVLFRIGLGGGTGMDISQGEGYDATPIANDAGCSLVTVDPSGFAQLRVTRSNGERYVMDVIELPGHPGIYAAVIGVPEGEMVSYEVLDAQGEVVLQG